MNYHRINVLPLLETARQPRVPRRLANRVFLLLPAAVGLIAGGCQKAAPPAPPPPIVQVMELAATNVPLSIEFIGQIESPTNVEIRARVESFVQEIPFVEGSNVTAGQMLFVLDKKPFRERLMAAKGMLAEAQAALKKYETDVSRLTPLAKVKAVPQQDLDNALASVDMGKANVLSAEARVESATIDLGYCEVKSPVNGLIGAKQVSIGELVGKGSPTLLATISTLNPVWFSCNVSEAQFMRSQTESLRTGRQVGDLSVTLIRADGSAHPNKGRFVFIDRAVDVKTGTLRVRAEFGNAEEILRPGMFGRIKVDLGMRTNSVVVPERAVTELQGKCFAWVVNSDNKATQRPVSVGETIGESVLIKEGVKVGERIVVEGQQKVREGAVVQPMTAAQLAEAAAQEAKKAEAKHAEAKSAKKGKE